MPILFDHLTGEMLNLPLASSTQNGLLSSTGAAKLESVVIGYVGYYATPTALTTAHPTGEDGQFASVGTTDTFWIWDSDTNAWKDSGTASVVTWASLTGKPTTIVLMKSGTVDDAGVITLSDETEVADLPIAGFVQFTAANTAQGVAIGDIYQKKLQDIIIGETTVTNNIAQFIAIGKEATTSSAGLMSASDKSKLDGLDSTSATWNSITGKPTVLAQYNGTVLDSGVITLENSVAVADIALGSVVKFTSENTVQGVEAGDLFQKKLQSVEDSYDDSTLIVSGNTNTPAVNGTYTLYSGTGTSRIFYMDGDPSSYQIYFSVTWRIAKSGTCYARYTGATTDPWDLGGWYDNLWGGYTTLVTRSALLAYDRIAQFTPVGKEATTTKAGLMSASDKEKLDSLSSGLPTGTMIGFSGDVEDIPGGLLLCNAANISRTSYADLFSVIGEKYGPGDGSTTFTLPDAAPEFINNFVALGGTSRDWRNMVTFNGSVYACVQGVDIFKQTNGVGPFVALEQGALNWWGICVAGSDLYACCPGGDIYKQTNGVGDFVALGQTARNWRCMTALGNNIYAGTYSGDIYMQTNKTGDFVALGQISNDWLGMTTLGSNVYAADNTGDIYMQTGGTGNFVALGQTSRAWYDMTVIGNDVYAAAQGKDIYKQTNGVGDFLPTGQGGLNWCGITSFGNDLYSNIAGGDIYRRYSTLKLIKY